VPFSTLGLLVAVVIVYCAVGASLGVASASREPEFVDFSLSRGATPAQVKALEQRLRADKRIAHVWYVTCEQQVEAMNIAIPGLDRPPSSYCASSGVVVPAPFVCTTAKPSAFPSPTDTTLTVLTEDVLVSYGYPLKIAGVRAVGGNVPPAGALRYSPCVYYVPLKP
jgi:hypothetical protein